MKIKISSVVAENLAALYREITVSLENALCPAFEGKAYGGGIEQFSVFVVAVDSQKTENDRFCANYDKAGRYKHPLTHAFVRYISFALPFDPDIVSTMRPDQVREQLCSSLIARLNDPGIKLPRDFAFNAFARDLRDALQIYMHLAR